jgi:hypothetical protein
MRFILFQRGATSWGFQIGRLYLYWPRPVYWRHGSRPEMGWERD